MKKWLSSILAVVMLVAMFVPAAGGAEAGSAPVLVSASNMSDKMITLTFDKQLTATAGSGYSSVTLDASKFALGGADGIHVSHATAKGYEVSLTLTKRLNDIPSVTLSIAAGGVTSSAGTANVAVSGYTIQTLAGMIAILKAMGAENVNPTISDVVRYARSGVSNVIGAPGIGSDDMRFLMKLIGMGTTEKPTLQQWIGKADELLSSVQYQDVTGTVRTTLASRVEAAKQALNAPESIAYDYGVAGLAMAKAHQAFLDYAQLPVEPRLWPIGSNPEVRVAHTPVTMAMHELTVPVGMTVGQLKQEVGSRYPFAVRESATSSAVVADAATITKAMVVLVDAPNSKMYEIRPQRTVSTIEELKQALANSGISIVRIANSIDAKTESITVPHGVLVTADSVVSVTLQSLTNEGIVSSYVTYIGYADTAAKLRQDVDGMEFQKIDAKGIDPYSGLLSLKMSNGDWGTKHYYQLGTTAYVANATQLQYAFEADDINRVFLTGDITVSGTLVIPAHVQELASSAAVKLVAAGLTQTSYAGTLNNVVLVNADDMLHKIGTNPNVEIALRWSSADPYVIYVPYGMTAAELLNEVDSVHDWSIRASGSTDAASVTGTAALTKSMVIRVESTIPAVFEIRPEAVVTDIASLQSALANEAVVSVKIMNDIIAPDVSIAANNKPLRAMTSAKLEIAGLTSNPWSLSGITLAGHADNDLELLALVNNSFFMQIQADGIGEYNGLLQARRDMNGSFFFAKDSMAYVGSHHELVDALADSSIDTIYLVGDIAMPYGSSLTFPADREVQLTASAPRILEAYGFTNAPDAASISNVSLVDPNAPVSMTAQITGFEIGEGYLHGFDVVFDDELPELAWNQPKEAIIERVVVTDEYGDDQELNNYSLTWDEGNKHKFRISTPGFNGDFQLITVYLIEDESGNGLDIANNPVKYIVMPTFAEIINPVIADSKLTSFDIKFSRALADASMDAIITGGPSQFISYFDIEDEEGEYSVDIGEISEAQLTKLSNDTLRFTGLEQPLTGELQSFFAMLNFELILEDKDGIPVMIMEAAYIPAVSSDEEIVASGMEYFTPMVKLGTTFGSYEGLYFKPNIEASYFKRYDGTAIAFNYSSMEQALEDETVHTIYVAADFQYDYPTLEFPARSLKLAASVNRMISADAILNEAGLELQNVSLAERFIGLGARVEPVHEGGNITALNLSFNQTVSESVYGSGTFIDAIEFYYEGVGEPEVVTEADILEENWGWSNDSIELKFVSPYSETDLLYAKVIFKPGMISESNESMSILTYTSDVETSITETTNDGMLTSLSVNFSDPIAISAIDAGEDVLQGPFYVRTDDQVRVVDAAEYTISWNAERTQVTIHFSADIPIINSTIAARLNPSIVVSEDGRSLQRYKIEKWYLV